MRHNTLPHVEETIRTFALPGLLPEGQTFILNMELGTLSLIGVQGDLPHMVAEQQFSGSELALLVPLLEAYPHYCPYEVLFAVFMYRENVTQEKIDECRVYLQEAMDDGLFDQGLKPIRATMSRTRSKMLVLGVKIAAILETGYILKRIVTNS